MFIGLLILIQYLWHHCWKQSTQGEELAQREHQDGKWFHIFYKFQCHDGDGKVYILIQTTILHDFPPETYGFNQWKVNKTYESGSVETLEERYIG